MVEYKGACGSGKEEEMTLGRAIKFVRTARNLTLEQVAAMSSISIGYLSLIERDRRDPSFYTVVRISENLKIPLILLLSLVGTDESETSQKLQAELMKLLRKEK